jgi:hypothetical protein
MMKRERPTIDRLGASRYLLVTYLAEGWDLSAIRSLFDDVGRSTLASERFASF